MKTRELVAIWQMFHPMPQLPLSARRIGGLPHLTVKDVGPSKQQTAYYVSPLFARKRNEWSDWSWCFAQTASRGFVSAACFAFTVEQAYDCRTIVAITCGGKQQLLAHTHAHAHKPQLMSYLTRSLKASLDQTHLGCLSFCFSCLKRTFYCR